jgi:hypothetical protein
VTSYNQLRNEALAVERWNRLHPGETPRDAAGDARDRAQSGTGSIASTDYMKALPDMVSRWIGRPFTPLGTDGFGRSDTRAALRRHFEIDAEHIVIATLRRAREAGRAGAGRGGEGGARSRDRHREGRPARGVGSGVGSTRARQRSRHLFEVAASSCCWFLPHQDQPSADLLRADPSHDEVRAVPHRGAVHVAAVPHRLVAAGERAP